MSEHTHFQYCQKLVVIDHETESVLLARRKGEADYDGVYSLIGGKMETTDTDLIEGMRREKIEEIGARALIEVAPDLSYNIFFRKKDGNSMVLPHYYARYAGGEIELSEEYSDSKWVPVAKVDSFEPKIDTIPDAVQWALRIKEMIDKSRGRIVRL